MSYQEAMEAAGAEVVAFEQFGSYQGDWWAKVRYKGETGWVQGSYGSCSGCDAFEAEFGWYEDACDEHHRHQTDCDACQEAAASYRQRLAEFGRSYLDDLLLTQGRAEEEAARYIEWDSKAHAEPELRVVLEQRVRPGRAAAV